MVVRELESDACCVSFVEKSLKRLFHRVDLFAQSV